jgi:hypothetical protein
VAYVVETAVLHYAVIYEGVIPDRWQGATSMASLPRPSRGNGPVNDERPRSLTWAFTHSLVAGAGYPRWLQPFLAG